MDAPLLLPASPQVKVPYTSSATFSRGASSGSPRPVVHAHLTVTPPRTTSRAAETCVNSCSPPSSIWGSAIDSRTPPYIKAVVRPACSPTGGTEPSTPTYPSIHCAQQGFSNARRGAKEKSLDRRYSLRGGVRASVPTTTANRGVARRIHTRQGSEGLVCSGSHSASSSATGRATTVTSAAAQVHTQAQAHAQLRGTPAMLSQPQLPEQAARHRTATAGGMTPREAPTTPRTASASASTQQLLHMQPARGAVLGPAAAPAAAAAVGAPVPMQPLETQQHVQCEPSRVPVVSPGASVSLGPGDLTGSAGSGWAEGSASGCAATTPKRPQPSESCEWLPLSPLSLHNERAEAAPEPARKPRPHLYHNYPTPGVYM